jgi:osmotically inducible lipoprotein OsmB
MNTLGKISRAAGAFAISAALLASAAPASASEDGRNTTVGAGLGAVTGGVLTHGSAGGIVGGALVGGLAGHALSNHHKHYGRRGYYDRDHHYRYYR